MEREHQNYFGQTATPFVIVSEFELTEKLLRIVFDGYASTARFDAGDEPLPNLRREFLIDGERLEEMIRNCHELFDSIKERTLQIAQVPADYELKHLHLLIAKWILVINATRSTKDDGVVRTKTAPEYHSIIADNLELVAQVLTVAWQYGKDNDPWLAQLTEISDFKFSRK